MAWETKKEKGIIVFMVLPRNFDESPIDVRKRKKERKRDREREQ